MRDFLYCTAVHFTALKPMHFPPGATCLTALSPPQNQECRQKATALTGMTALLITPPPLLHSFAPACSFPGPPLEEVNPKKKILEKLFPDMNTDASECSAVQWERRRG